MSAPGHDDEERLLRSVALQNASAILRAQERAEQGLLLANRQITSILESITDGFVVLDREFRYVYMNGRAEELVLRGGRRREAVMGKPIWEAFPELVGSESEVQYRRAMRDQVTVRFQTQRVGVTFDVRAYPSPEGLSVYYQDVTEQRRTEEALREREQRLSAIFSHAAVGIAVAELDGTLVEVNERFADILGYTPAELMGRTFGELTHPDDLASTMECMRELIAGDVAHSSQEKRYLRKHGGSVWSLTSATAIRDEAGAPVRFVGIVEDISARKRIEAERERLIGVLERSLNEVYIFHPRTLRFEYVNEGARRNLGYTLSEMSRKTPIDIKPAFTEETFRAMLAPLLAGEREKVQFETLHRRRDGSDYPVEVHLQHVTYADEPVFLAVVLDITERQRVEDELRRSERQLQAFADSIPHLAWIAHADGDIFWYNRRWYEYTGTTEAQMAVVGWEALHSPEMLGDVQVAWGHSLRTGEPMEIEFPLRGADGEYRWFLTRANPVRDEEGRVVRWFGTNTNVDEVRRTREALREETRLLELLNDTGASIASKLDLETLVQTVTDSATKLTGADFGAFFYNVIGDQGEAFLLFTLSGAPREAFEDFGHPRATSLFGPTFRGEGVIRSDDVRKDPRYGRSAPHHGMPAGHLPVRSYLAVPVVSRGGEVIGGLFFGHKEPGVFSERSERIVVGVAAQAAIAIDNARLYESAQKQIAERSRVESKLRAAQEELNHHAENLESEVAERTASLREALAQLEEFSYTVSHDLRAPIRAISGYARIFEEDHAATLGDDTRWLLSRIAGSAAHMARLVDDILTLSRAASAKMQLHPVALQPFMERIVAQHPGMQEPEARVAVEAPDSVVADDALLEQALTNLLSNAVKFVGPGETPVVRVWSERHGARVRIWVQDNGIGVRAEHRDKLFGMFQRLPATEGYEGTGIGLALVRKAAERMEGSVGMEPAARGSRFWIELGGLGGR